MGEVDQEQWLQETERCECTHQDEWVLDEILVSS